MADSSDAHPDPAKRLCVVTGASSGIGAQCAIDLAAAGHPVLLVARRGDKMQALIDEGKIPAKLAMVAAVDILDSAGLKAAIAKAEAHFSAYADLIVNNAGVMFLDPLVDQPESKISLMTDVNVKGVINGCQAVIPGMTERKRGTIINVSSMAGRKPYGAHVAYCGTKFAVRGMSLCLQAELQPLNIRVTVLCPGVVSTELLGHNTKGRVGAYEGWVKGCPGRMLKTTDISAAVMYIYQAPQAVCVRELAIAPTAQDC